YYAILQNDGNVVVYDGAGPGTGTTRVMWNAVTFGHSPSFLILQGDGNFVLYNGADPDHQTGPIWATSSNGPTSIASLDDNGVLRVQTGTAPANVTATRWSSAGKNLGSSLTTGKMLSKYDYLVSPGQKYWATLQ